MSDRSLNELLSEAADRFDMVEILEELDFIYSKEHYVFSFQVCDDCK